MSVAKAQAVARAIAAALAGGNASLVASTPIVLTVDGVSYGASLAHEGAEHFVDLSELPAGEVRRVEALRP